MSSVPPTDLRWFKLSRYEACKRWSLETWLRVLKGRKFCYEFCDEKKRYLDEWPKNLEALLKSGELVDREEILRIEELLNTLRKSRGKKRILNEACQRLRGCGYFLDIFRDPQELLDEEPGLNQYVKFELGDQRTSVEPLSFTEAKRLSEVVHVAEFYMEPKYDIVSCVDRGFRNSPSQDEGRYGPMKVGVRITDPKEYEIYRKLLGYPSDITGDYKDVVLDSDFKRLSVDEVIGEKRRDLLPLDRIYLSVDPWADESVFIAEALACRRNLCVKSRMIVNPLSKKMRMGQLPVFESLNRGEMA